MTITEKKRVTSALLGTTYALLSYGTTGNLYATRASRVTRLCRSRSGTESDLASSVRARRQRCTVVRRQAYV